MRCEGERRGSCVEDSSFHGIMTMGERPFSTCMSYADGSYSECLLSYFDANKKIVYRLDQSGSTVARAVIRLTKAARCGNAGNGGLGFVDIEASGSPAEEFPILFLERMYSGYQGKERIRLMGDMVRLAGRKAAGMGVRLVASDSYEPYLGSCMDGYRKEHISVYITRSKAGTQYLDSFSGKASRGNGDDCFRSACCFIKND